jgi:hypothetical protein
VKEFYLILEKKKKYQYGAFPRNKVGKEKALKYIRKLKREHKMDFILR